MYILKNINIRYNTMCIIAIMMVLINIKSIGQVHVTVPDTSAKEGKRILIPINVSDLTNQNVRSYEFKLLYDPKILKAKRIKDSETLSNRFSWHVDKDIERGNITVEAKGWLPLVGSGTLIKIVFEVVGEEGFSSLSFDYFEFNNGSPSAQLTSSEFWVLNEKKIEFKRNGDGDGKLKIDNILYKFPVDIELIKGKTYEIEGLPDNNSEFLKWTGDIDSDDNPLTYKVEREQKIECTFEIKKFNIEVVLNPSEAGTVSGFGKYKKGENVILRATAYHGWSFVGWYINGVLLSNELTYPLVVDSDIIFEAEFEKKIYNVNVIVNPSEGGTASGGGYYYYQDMAELVANSTDGWEFTNWSMNGSDFSHNSSIQFQVEDNSNLTANFERSLYSLSLSTDPLDGGITSGGGYFYYDQSATISAQPNEGWVFDYWSDADSIYSYDSVVTIAIYEERNLVANFSLLTSLDENQTVDITWFMSDPYPNPFNPMSKFRFSLVRSAKVTIIIVDLNGRIVSNLVDNENFSAGIYEKSFDARNLASGVYFYRYIIRESLVSNVITKNGKLILLK